MIRIFVCSAWLILLLLTRVASATEDVHSYANLSDYQQVQMHLDLDVNFDKRQLLGSVRIRFEKQHRKAPNELILDTRDLTIRSVTYGSGRASTLLPFRLGADAGFLGRSLTIELPRRIPQTFELLIEYETAPSASGLQWLTPRQTAGGEHPFLFSQSQAVHARSWIPLQDSPAARFTYTAKVKTPPELLAVMSADNPTGITASGEHRFAMEEPIPSYLMAIAAGNLAFAPMGARTGVYAEPEILDSALAEFEDTEKMLEVSERLFGPYRWGRYDLLILPPSFPFGGMENPRLSFITPTVIAGDKSLVALIAHELAHSWSGNLVTNSTWRDLWLNEGFTVFLESRIMEALYGEERRIMEERLGYEDLIANFDDLEPEMEQLAVDLEGKDPDLVFSQVPYEKGRLMLVWLDQQFGRERMNQFLFDYLDKFAFQSVTTELFLEFVEADLLSEPGSKVTRADLEAWIFSGGLPADAPVPPANVFDSVKAASQQWQSGEIAANTIDTADWTTQHWLYFLNNLPAALTTEQLVDLDSAFSLTQAGNNEIAHSWLKIAIRNQYQPAWARLEEYLLTIGRNKLVKPLYTELMKSDSGKVFARDVFKRARPGYHPLTVTVNSRIVYPEADGLE